MYDPASAEGSWEYVELYNNTGSAINFANTPYVFDDDDDSQMALPNITSGSIAQGGVGVLFNASGSGNTLANMQAAWGNGVNFIPVSQWTDLSNSGDTVAVWSSFAAYNSETQSSMSPRRTTTHAAAAVTYDNVAGNGWPTNNNAGSIFMANLTSNPATPGSWSRSDSGNALAPQPVLAEVVDSPGGDVGSPGFVPGTVVASLAGDYNGNGVVDMADYLLWRDALQNGTALLHDTTPGSVTTADFDVWRANYGRTSGAGSLAGAGSVPEPAGWMLGAMTAFVWVWVGWRRDVVV
jgi:hypothetical protein